MARVLQKSDAVFEVIALFRRNPHASRILRSIVDKPEIPFYTRVLALAALEKVESKEEALRILKTISLESDNPFHRIVCTFGFIELGPSTSYHEVREELVAVKDNPQVGPDWLMSIADNVADQGDQTLAAEISWSVLSAVDAVISDVRSAVKLLLGQAGIDTGACLDEIIEQASRLNSAQKTGAAREILNSGHVDHAKILAYSILDDMGASSSALVQAVEILLQDAPSEAIQDLLEVLQKRPDWSSERAELLDALIDAGCTGFVISEALSILEEPGSEPYDIGYAASAWLTSTEAESAEELMNILARRTHLDAWARANVSRALADSGYIAEAAEIAYPIFSDPTADNYDLGRAAQVALLEEAPAVDAVLDILKMRSAAGVKERIRMVEVLALLERSDEVITPALQIMSDPSIDRKSFQSTLSSLISATGVSAAEEIVESLKRQGNPTYRFTAADYLAKAGALKAAVSIWCDLITVDTLSTVDAFTALNRLINTGHREEVIKVLGGRLVDNDQNKYKHGRIRRLLSWAVLSNPDDVSSPILQDGANRIHGKSD
ncbi:hypothetical protein [Streptomyces europaeiscabiei]|uniref:hypothetical protein n=1 Tax=Streptomyces europaeiscabiei TaxID=146819 RepID=UPI002E18CD0B